MKRTFIISLMAAALAFVSCTSTALDPLTGMFPDAQEPVLTTLNSSSFEKTATNRLFTLSFSGNGGAAVEVSLVGARAQYYLESNVYGPGEGTGCFLVGPTTINGKTVKSGNITVQKKAGDLYKLIFVLFDADGTPYRTKWEGDIVYEPDPEPVQLTKVFSAQSNVASGTNSVTVSLGSAGVDATFDPMTYSTTYSGDGNFLAIDFYSKDGYLHEGTYKASAQGGVINEGEFGIGWDPGDLWGIGINFTNWGTCWWTVANGATSAEKVTSGTINVEMKGNKYIITWGEEDTYPHWAVFNGEIPALLPAAKPEAEYSYTDELSDPVDETFAPVAGVKTHNLTLKNKAGEEVAWFSLVLKEGETNYDGDYLCKEYAHEEYTFGNGYDLSAWGMGLGGSRYMKDGNVVLINPGEWISVFQLDDDLWEIMGNGFDFVFGTGGGSDGPVYAMTDELSDPVDETFAPVSGVKTHNLTLKNDAGEEIAWFQLVLTEGSEQFEGEYVCKEYAHEDHTFGNGYDLSMWGMGMGGTRYMVDGAVVMVNPGETLTVIKVGNDTYKFVGSTGYEFVGQF